MSRARFEPGSNYGAVLAVVTLVILVQPSVKRRVTYWTTTVQFPFGAVLFVIIIVPGLAYIPHNV